MWPVVVLATAAAIIASQALITGSFSIVQQASGAEGCSCTASARARESCTALGWAAQHWAQHSTGLQAPSRPAAPYPSCCRARWPTRPMSARLPAHRLLQAMAMNAFPRMTVKHTSQHNVGQVYIPEVNWLLLGGAMLVVGVFKTSASIGNAYGGHEAGLGVMWGGIWPAWLPRAPSPSGCTICPPSPRTLTHSCLRARPARLLLPLPSGLAVICVMTLDTSLLAILMSAGWEWHPAAVAAFWLPFTAITATYLSSNLLKVPKGAWFRRVGPPARPCLNGAPATAAAAAAATQRRAALALTCRCPGALAMPLPPTHPHSHPHPPACTCLAAWLWPQCCLFSRTCGTGGNRRRCTMSETTRFCCGSCMRKPSLRHTRPHQQPRAAGRRRGTRGVSDRGGGVCGYVGMGKRPCRPPLLQPVPPCTQLTQLSCTVRRSAAALQQQPDGGAWNVQVQPPLTAPAASRQPRCSPCRPCDWSIPRCRLHACRGWGSITVSF